MCVCKRRGGVEWQGAQHFLQNCMCTQGRLISASTSAQSDQSLQGTLWLIKDQKHLQADSKNWMYRLVRVRFSMEYPWEDRSDKYKRKFGSK